MKTTNAKQDESKSEERKTEYSRAPLCSHLMNIQLVYLTTANFFVLAKCPHIFLKEDPVNAATLLI